MQYLKFIDPITEILVKGDMFIRITSEDEEGLIDTKFLRPSSNTINPLGMMTEAFQMCWNSGVTSFIELVEYNSPLRQKLIRSIMFKVT